MTVPLPPQHLQPVFVAHEFFAWAPGAGAGDFGLLDPSPVVVIGRHDPAAFEQPLQSRRALALAFAARRDCRSDLVGDFVAVGAVGADRPRRATPRPADGIESPPADVLTFLPSAFSTDSELRLSIVKTNKCVAGLAALRGVT